MALPHFILSVWLNLGFLEDIYQQIGFLPFPVSLKLTIIQASLNGKFHANHQVNYFRL